MPPEPRDRGLDDAGAILGAPAVGGDGQHLGAGLARRVSARLGKAGLAPRRDGDARAFGASVRAMP